MKRRGIRFWTGGALLFLLALIIGGGSIVNVIKIVTGFTVGHSITLALAALDVVRS